MKKCSKGDRCLTGNPWQPLENFSKRKASADGLSYTCKTCERDTAKKSYLRKRAKQKQHNRYLLNREKVLERSKKHYKENREMRLAQAADYRKANPEVARRADALRRKRLREVYSEPYTREEIIERDKYTCGICGEVITDSSEIHIDHIVPIGEGGADAPFNVRVTCRTCNLERPKDGRDNI